MPSIWRHDPTLDQADSMTGCTVRSLDEHHVGAITSTSWGTDHAHVVVRTGSWDDQSHRLVPAGLVETVDPSRGVVQLLLTLPELADGPILDEIAYGAGPDEMFWAPYEGYYGGPETTNPLMRRGPVP